VIIDAFVIAAFRMSPLGAAFTDTIKYPDSLIQYALCEADTETGGGGWGSYQNDCHNMKQRGMFLYAAGWLTTFYPDGIAGGVSGDARLNVSQKSVGDESITYRVAQMVDAGTDFLTFTAYGQAFFRLRRRAGMGAIAL